MGEGVRVHSGFSGRLMAIAWVSFASGLPLMLVGSTLQAWFTVSGVNLMTIGILSFVGFPYVIKFVWSPIVDRVQWNFMGRRRGWIFIMQWLLVVGLWAMAFMSPSQWPVWTAAVATLVAFFSATQDIAVDAYRTDVLFPSERGPGSAVTNISFRVAMMVASFVALILAAKTSWRLMYLLMGALMGVLAVGTCWTPRPRQDERAPKNLAQAVVEPFKNFFQRFGVRQALVFVVFIVFYKFADALALSLNTVFLLRGIGFSLITVGTVAKITSVVAVLLGSLIAGILLPRWGTYRSLWRFGWLQLCTALGFMLLAVIGKNVLLMGAVMFLDYFFGGMSSVAFLVLLMGFCDPRYTATQYAIFSALSAVTRVCIGPVAAVMVGKFGWPLFYLTSFVVGIPVMVLLYVMRDKIRGIGQALPG